MNNEKCSLCSFHCSLMSEKESLLSHCGIRLTSGNFYMVTAVSSKETRTNGSTREEIDSSTVNQIDLVKSKVTWIFFNDNNTIQYNRCEIRIDSFLLFVSFPTLFVSHNSNPFDIPRSNSPRAAMNAFAGERAHVATRPESQRYVIN